jgi:hypothetical protein
MSWYRPPKTSCCLSRMCRRCARNAWIDCSMPTRLPTSPGEAWTGDAKDWRMKFAHVPQVLRHLHESGFLLAVMSNESTARLKNPDAIQKALDRKCGRIEAWACVALLHCICCVVLLEVHRRRLWWTKTHAVHTSDRCL